MRSWLVRRVYPGDENNGSRPCTASCVAASHLDTVPSDFVRTAWGGRWVGWLRGGQPTGRGAIRRRRCPRCRGYRLPEPRTMITLNICNQVLFALSAGGALIDRKYLPAYAILLTAIAGLVGMEAISSPNFRVAAGVTSVTWVALLWSTRRLVTFGGIFPRTNPNPFDSSARRLSSGTREQPICVTEAATVLRWHRPVGRVVAGVCKVENETAVARTLVRYIAGTVKPRHGAAQCLR